MTEIIVLLGETRMLQMGSSLKGIPLNNVVAVLASGKNLALLKGKLIEFKTIYKCKIEFQPVDKCVDVHGLFAHGSFVFGR